jgi:hypothetical protein
LQANPLPPLFSTYNYLKLSILFVILTTIVVVSAAVFAYSTSSLAARWVDPPVRLQDPGTLGVTVDLYDDASARVDVTSQGTLTRVRRSAFIWDDYSDDPFTSGRLTVNMEAWSWNPAGYVAVTARSLAQTWGGACVAYYSTSPPAGANMVYVLVKELHITNANNQYSGLITANSPMLFNLMGYRRGTGSNRFITIRRFSGAWSTVASDSLTLAENTWFIFLGRREYSGTVGFTVYDTAGVQQGSPIGAADTAFQVNLVGVGVYRAGVTITAHFDDFVACADANPRFVNVTGLEEGWTVYLYDGNGNPVNQATAGPDGKASLNVLTRPIVRNASFEIRLGEAIILPTQSFSEVVGGDVYECSVKHTAILGFKNQDSKAYSVYLRVESIQVPAGYSGSINLWVGPTAGATPIQINGSSVIVGTSSETVLNPFDTSYVYGTFPLCSTPSSQIVLALSLHYYIPSSKVEVEYPVEVNIHG